MNTIHQTITFLTQIPTMMLFWFNKSASSISAIINEPYPFNPGDKKVNKVFDVINTSLLF